MERLVLRRPRTPLAQLREAAEKVDGWILVTDDDAEITGMPDLASIPGDVGFVAFRWEDSADAFGTRYYGIGLFRGCMLREVLKADGLSSMGLDLYLASHLKTVRSKEGRFRHPSHISAKAFFRYGKGRALYAKAGLCPPVPEVGAFRLKYLWCYGGYVAGYVYGLVSQRKDEPW